MEKANEREGGPAVEANQFYWTAYEAGIRGQPFPKEWPCLEARVGYEHGSAVRRMTLGGENGLDKA